MAREWHGGAEFGVSEPFRGVRNMPSYERIVANLAMAATDYSIHGYSAHYKALRRHVRTLFCQYKAERSIALWASISEGFE